MPYIGSQNVIGRFEELDSLNASATDDYTLKLNGADYFPETVNNLLVSINGVIQGSSTMSLNGAVLTVGATLSSSDTIDFVRVFGNVGTVSTPTDGSVTANKIGTGAVVLTSKVSGVLPIANGGTGATSLSTGKVLQVKQAIDQNQRTVDSTSYATRSSSLSVAITPTASTSEFLVSFCTEAYSALDAVSLYLTIFRGSTDIGNSSGYGLARHYVNASDVSMGMNGVKLDDPNTASEITYTVQAKLSAGSGPAYFNSQTIGTLTVMEIGA